MNEVAKAIAGACRATLRYADDAGIALETVEHVDYRVDTSSERGYAYTRRSHRIPQALFSEDRMPRVLELREVRELLGAARELPPRIPGWRGGFAEDHVVRMILQHALMEHFRDGVSLDEAGSRVGAKLERGAFGPCTSKFVAPISGLHLGDDAPIRLAEGVELRPIRDEELQLFALPDEMRALVPDRFGRLETVLVETVQHGPDVASQPGAAVDRLITALRLMGAHGVACHSIAKVSDFWEWGRESRGGPAASLHTHGFGVNTPEHRAELIQYFSWVSVVEELDVQPMPVALRRFRLAVERASAEDRFIDISIALEAALMAGVGKNITERFARRGSRVLSSDPQEQAEMETRLDALYNKRSRLLHGTIAELDDEDHHDVLPFAELALRSVFDTLLPIAAKCGDRRSFARYLESFDK